MNRNTNTKIVLQKPITPVRHMPEEIEIYPIEEEAEFTELQSHMPLSRATELYFEWLKSKDVDPYGRRLESVNTGEILIDIVKKGVLPTAGVIGIGFVVTIFAAVIIKAVLVIGFIVVVYLIFYFKPEKPVNYGDSGGYRPRNTGNDNRLYTFNNCNFKDTTFQ